MSSNAAFQFPSARGVLWDRTPLQHPIYLRSESIIPSLFLTPSNIRSILQSVANTCHSNSKGGDPISIATTESVTVVYLESLAEANSQTFKSGLLDQVPSYVMSISNKSNNSSEEWSLSIPFQVKRDASLTFNDESTS